MLEDESGRIRLVGDRLRSARLVTGVIMGALGLEIANGDFEIVDYCFAGLPPQASVDAESMTVDSKQAKRFSPCGNSPNSYLSTGQADSDEWVAVVSGFDVGALDPPDAQLQMLAEYLSGEACGPEEQLGAARVSRLIIAGNSLSPVVAETQEIEKKGVSAPC